MKKHNKIVIILIVILLVVVAVVGVMVNKSDNEKIHKDVLSNEQIKNLREDYPLISGGISTMDFVSKTFLEVVETSQAMVDVKVVEELPSYELTIKMSQDEDLYCTAVFYPYKVEIIDIITNNGIIKEEDKYFTLTLSDLEIDVFPKLSVGDEGIFPVEKGEGPHKDEYSISIDTYYYVTEDDYVLSAYTEDEEYTYTGNTKEFLTCEIESINNKCCKSKIEKAMNISVPDIIDVEKCNIEDDKVEMVFYVDDEDLQQLKEEIEKSDKIKDKVDYVQENDKVRVIIRNE